MRGVGVFLSGEFLMHFFAWSKQLYLFNLHCIPFHVELQAKPIRLKLFGAILIKMELFCSSTEFFHVVFIFQHEWLKNCSILRCRECHDGTLRDTLFGPSYVGLLRQKSAKFDYVVVFQCTDFLGGLDCRYLTLVCDTLKKRMFLQNVFSWHYFGNLLCFSSYPHHSTIPQSNKCVMSRKIRVVSRSKNVKRSYSSWKNYIEWALSVLPS
jgi:hypothetical protein